MQYLVILSCLLTQTLGEKLLMNNISRVKLHTYLISVMLSLSFLIYFLATSAKVPVRITLITPSWEIRVEIQPHQSPSPWNF